MGTVLVLKCNPIQETQNQDDLQRGDNRTDGGDMNVHHITFLLDCGSSVIGFRGYECKSIRERRALWQSLRPVLN